MAILHALPGEAVDIRPFGPRLGEQSTFAVLKSQDLEVMRLVLQAGRSLPPHKVAGEITIHCIEGRLEIDASGRKTELQPGHLVLLAGGELHSVLALEPSSALVTVTLRR